MYVEGSSEASHLYYGLVVSLVVVVSLLLALAFVLYKLKSQSCPVCKGRLFRI